VGLMTGYLGAQLLSLGSRLFGLTTWKVMFIAVTCAVILFPLSFVFAFKKRTIFYALG